MSALWKAVWAAALMLAAPAGLTAQEPVKVATDPDKAGPDFTLQGEYLGVTGGKSRLGAEVVARGAGKFVVNVLPGGLRGEGGDYAKRADATGKAEDGTLTVQSKDGKWSATAAGGKMTGKTAAGEEFTLEKVVRTSKTLGMKPPPGAVVLYAGPESAGEWNAAKVEDGFLVGNNTSSKKKFGDHKLHLEFRLTYMPFASGQGRSNSGVYVQGRNEVQVLDSFGLKGGGDECGALYGRAAPKVNMCYPPLQWQTYDIEVRGPRIDPESKKQGPTVISVWHNGVLVHDKVEMKGGGGPGPVLLQSHGGRVRYRNIWALELDRDEGKGAAASPLTPGPSPPAGGEGGVKTPFYAMDTCTKRPYPKNDIPPAAQLDMLKELGYAGIAWTEEPPEEVKAAANEAHQRGLKMYAIYCAARVTSDGDLEHSPRLGDVMAALKGHGSVVWLHIGGKGPDFAGLTGQEPAVKKLRALAAVAAENGLRVAVYPHVGEWTARFGYATKLAKVVDHPAFGVTFNLCHSLAMGDEKNIPALLREAKGRLFAVTVNGADSGLARPEWGRLIQTLDRGTFDVGVLLRQLREAGYDGPVGLQGYGIGGDRRQNLAASMAAWRKLSTAAPR